MKTWKDVEGWLTLREGHALQLLALDRTVLELGAWKGRSTSCLAEVAGYVMAVDWFRGDDGCGFVETLREYVDNLKACGVRHKVGTVVGDIAFVRGLLRPRAFDLVFVDDDHSPEGALRSTELALECVKPGGHVAWHDADEPGVVAALKAFNVEAAGRRDRLVWAAAK